MKKATGGNAMDERSSDDGLCGSLEGKYLAFKLDREIYGIGILKVQEINGMLKVTHIPRSPKYVRGVINLRGKVVPVMDLRLRFGMEEHKDTELSCIIVLQVGDARHTFTVGIVIDEVAEVFDIKASQIEPPPSFGSEGDSDFILGVGKVNEKVIMLLDADKLFNLEEIASAARN
jgi:purine-binding chemotaxis protein CheW